MAEALTSWAVRQAAWAVASLTEVVPLIFIRLRRWLWKWASASVRSAIRDMVLRASMG